MVFFQLRIRLPTGCNPLYPVVNRSHDLKPKLSKALKMVATEANSKRPVCPSCSKPTWLCLCTRIRMPGLENSVRVTILQHSLERKHPLNSARIARLGLKNVTVATVSNVNFEAQFVISLREMNAKMVLDQNSFDGSNFSQAGGNRETRKLFAECPTEESTNLAMTSGECSWGNDLSGNQITQNHEEGVNLLPNSGLLGNNEVREPNTHLVSYASTLNKAVLDNETVVSNESESSQVGVDPAAVVQRGHQAPVITASIGKYGAIISLWHLWMPQIHIQKPKFEKILASPAASDALGRGFSVKKLQKRQLSGSTELEEYEEFELEVPPGSVLLFPSDCAVGIDGLHALGFEVKNLLVLDGTWAKATRMYNENPWLKLLPHLRLDSKKMSLFSEVRSQPKAGCLSTIESIVYALKDIGNEPEGLDNLLDVFESMVEDQRRCKDERLSKASAV